MKAAVLKNINDLTIVDLVVPEADDLEVGQVLVKVKAATICGAQIAEITGAKGPDRFLPHLLGHEGVGQVEAVGPGVTNVRISDRVVMHWRKGKGIEAKAPAYFCHNHGQIAYRVGAGPVATFTEYAICSENRLTVIPYDVPAEVASLMGCAVTTGFGLVNNEAKLKIGQSILVFGVGGVGLNIVQAADLVSGFPIIAYDRVEAKVKLARLYGATHSLFFEDHPLLNDFSVKLRHVANRSCIDVVVDCTGDPRLIDYGLSVLSPEGGRLILVGQPKYDSGLFLPNFRNHYCGKTILDSQGGLTDPTVDIPRYLDLYRQQRIELDGIVTHRFKLTEIKEALSVVQSGHAGRVLLEMK